MTSWMDEKMLTTEEVAERLNTPVRTLEGWRHRKVGPEYVRLPRGVRYTESAVQKWLDERKVQTNR